MSASLPTPSIGSVSGQPLRMPMAKASRVTLFEREVRERLSLPAIDLLLSQARILSEGERVCTPHGGDTFYGSTMLTIDLQASETLVREACDATTVRRIATLMTSDGRIGRYLRQIAAAESARLAGVPLAQLSTRVRMRTEGRILYIDIDFDGSLPATAAAS